MPANSTAPSAPGPARWLVWLFATSVSLVSAMALAGLTDTERDLALQVGSAADWPADSLSLRRLAHPLGIQTLSVEANESKHSNGERLARVYQFDYNLQRSRLVLVDLDTQQVIRQQAINSIHLPLNDTEIQMALAALASAPELIDTLRDEQRSRGTEPLDTLADIDIKAFIFAPRHSLHPCTVQRCALLSLFDQTRTVFAIEPLVYLGSNTITTLQVSLDAMDDSASEAGQ